MVAERNASSKLALTFDYSLANQKAEEATQAITMLECDTA
jgi:hypothetical protein